MEKIRFSFKGKPMTQEFFFGIKKGINGFGIKDERGRWYDCLYDSETNEVKIFYQDTDKIHSIEKAVKL